MARKSTDGAPPRKRPPSKKKQEAAAAKAAAEEEQQRLQQQQQQIQQLQQARLQLRPSASAEAEEQRIMQQQQQLQLILERQKLQQLQQSLRQHGFTAGSASQYASAEQQQLQMQCMHQQTRVQQLQQSMMQQRPSSAAAAAARPSPIFPNGLEDALTADRQLAELEKQRRTASPSPSPSSAFPPHQNAVAGEQMTRRQHELARQMLQIQQQQQSMQQRPSSSAAARSATFPNMEQQLEQQRLMMRGLPPTTSLSNSAFPAPSPTLALQQMQQPMLQRPSTSAAAARPSPLLPTATLQQQQQLEQQLHNGLLSPSTSHGNLSFSPPQSFPGQPPMSPMHSMASPGQSAYSGNGGVSTPLAPHNGGSMASPMPASSPSTSMDSGFKPPLPPQSQVPDWRAHPMSKERLGEISRQQQAKLAVPPQEAMLSAPRPAAAAAAAPPPMLQHLLRNPGMQQLMHPLSPAAPAATAQSQQQRPLPQVVVVPPPASPPAVQQPAAVVAAAVPAAAPHRQRPQEVQQETCMLMTQMQPGDPPLQHAARCRKEANERQEVRMAMAAGIPRGVAERTIAVRNARREAALKPIARQSKTAASEKEPPSREQPLTAEKQRTMDELEKAIAKRCCIVPGCTSKELSWDECRCFRDSELENCTHKPPPYALHSLASMRLRDERGGRDDSFLALVAELVLPPTALREWASSSEMLVRAERALVCTRHFLPSEAMRACVFRFPILGLGKSVAEITMLARKYRMQTLLPNATAIVNLDELNLSLPFLPFLPLWSPHSQTPSPFYPTQAPQGEELNSLLDDLKNGQIVIRDGQRTNDFRKKRTLELGEKEFRRFSIPEDERREEKYAAYKAHLERWELKEGDVEGLLEEEKEEETKEEEMVEEVVEEEKEEANGEALRDDEPPILAAPLASFPSMEIEKENEKMEEEEEKAAAAPSDPCSSIAVGDENEEAMETELEASEDASREEEEKEEIEAAVATVPGPIAQEIATCSLEDNEMPSSLPFVEELEIGGEEEVEGSGASSNTLSEAEEEKEEVEVKEEMEEEQIVKEESPSIKQQLTISVPDAEMTPVDSLTRLPVSAITPDPSSAHEPIAFLPFPSEAGGEKKEEDEPFSFLNSPAPSCTGRSSRSTDSAEEEAVKKSPPSERKHSMEDIVEEKAEVVEGGEIKEEEREEMMDSPSIVVAHCPSTLAQSSVAAQMGPRLPHREPSPAASSVKEEEEESGVKGDEEKPSDDQLEETVEPTSSANDDSIEKREEKEEDLKDEEAQMEPLRMASSATTSMKEEEKDEESGEKIDDEKMEGNEAPAHTPSLFLSTEDFESRLECGTPPGSPPVEEVDEAEEEESPAVEEEELKPRTAEGRIEEEENVGEEEKRGEVEIHPLAIERIPQMEEENEEGVSTSADRRDDGEEEEKEDGGVKECIESMLESLCAADAMKPASPDDEAKEERVESADSVEEKETEMLARPQSQPSSSTGEEGDEGRLIDDAGSREDEELNEQPVDDIDANPQEGTKEEEKQEEMPSTLQPLIIEEIQNEKVEEEEAAPTPSLFLSAEHEDSESSLEGGTPPGSPPVEESADEKEKEEMESPASPTPPSTPSMLWEPPTPLGSPIHETVYEPAAEVSSDEIEQIPDEKVEEEEGVSISVDPAVEKEEKEKETPVECPSSPAAPPTPSMLWEPSTPLGSPLAVQESVDEPAAAAVVSTPPAKQLTRKTSALDVLLENYECADEEEEGGKKDTLAPTSPASTRLVDDGATVKKEVEEEIVAESATEVSSAEIEIDSIPDEKVEEEEGVSIAADPVAEKEVVAPAEAIPAEEDAPDDANVENEKEPQDDYEQQQPKVKEVKEEEVSTAPDAPSVAPRRTKKSQRIPVPEPDADGLYHCPEIDPVEQKPCAYTTKTKSAIARHISGHLKAVKQEGEHSASVAPTSSIVLKDEEEGKEQPPQLAASIPESQDEKPSTSRAAKEPTSRKRRREQSPPPSPSPAPPSSAASSLVEDMAIMDSGEDTAVEDDDEYVVPEVIDDRTFALLLVQSDSRALRSKKDDEQPSTSTAAPPPPDPPAPADAPPKSKKRKADEEPREATAPPPKKKAKKAATAAVEQKKAEDEKEEVPSTSKSTKAKSRRASTTASTDKPSSSQLHLSLHAEEVDEKENVEEGGGMREEMRRRAVELKAALHQEDFNVYLRQFAKNLKPRNKATAPRGKGKENEGKTVKRKAPEEGKEEGPSKKKKKEG